MINVFEVISGNQISKSGPILESLIKRTFPTGGAAVVTFQVREGGNWLMQVFEEQVMSRSLEN